MLLNIYFGMMLLGHAIVIPLTGWFIEDLGISWAGSMLIFAFIYAFSSFNLCLYEFYFWFSFFALLLNYLSFSNSFYPSKSPFSCFLLKYCIIMLYVFGEQHSWTSPKASSMSSCYKSFVLFDLALIPEMEQLKVEELSKTSKES